MSARVASVFRAMAKELEVAESDVLTLAYSRIETANYFYFRLPNAQRLEDYMISDISPFQTHWSEVDSTEPHSRAACELASGR